MKDYYYILGVARTASPEEIRQAYRKLSLKFHPDKNAGDKFFEDRFKEINEAYEVLYNPVRRLNYDESFVKKDSFRQTTTSSNQTPPRNDSPKIILFSADKSSIAIGDTITFRWHTENATSLELKPFGPSNPSGAKTVKVLGFNSSEGLEVEIKAYNYSNQVISRKIVILKRVVSSSQDKQQYTGKNDTKLIRFIRIVLYAGLIALVAWPLKFWLMNEVAIHKSQRTSDSIPAAFLSKDSLQNISKISDPFKAESKAISRWKGNHLKNGDSPFNICFGKGHRQSRSWILFQNRNDVDAVVCLINTITGKTIRNEYIRAGKDFRMSQVPSGSYTLKVAFGNDWNPTLISPCGSKGFFESNVSYSASDGYNDAIIIETINDGYSIRYSTNTITLQPVANGNMSQRGIDASQFFGQ